MLTNKNGAPFEQVAPSKNNLKASAQIIPQPSLRSKRVTRRSVAAELQFLLSARGARR